VSIEPQQSYFAHIPGHILNNKKLSSVCKIFYAEITTLIQKEGYCWAQNNFFVKNFGKDKRTIQRWIDTLEKENMIVVTYDDPKTGKGRKIFTLESWQAYQANSKNYYPVTKMSPPRDKNVAHSITSINTSSKSKETTTPLPKKAASPPVVVSSKTENNLKAIPGMSQKLFKKLVIDYSEDALEKAFKLTNISNPDNPIAFFQKALKENWNMPSSNKKQSPREWVEERFKHGKIYNGAECFINDESVAFQRGMSNHKQLKFKENGFKDRFESILRHFGIKP
jgi:helix-turn-helix protein